MRFFCITSRSVSERRTLPLTRCRCFLRSNINPREGFFSCPQHAISSAHRQLVDPLLLGVPLSWLTLWFLACKRHLLSRRNVRLHWKPFYKAVMNTINDPSGIVLRTPFPPSLSPRLCQLCRALGDWFISNWTSTAQPRCYTYKHHLSWKALSESASKGCSFCYQLALEGEERIMGGTIAHMIQLGRSTAFAAEMDGKNPKILVHCDKLEWCVLDVYTMPSRSVGCFCWL